MKTTIFKAFGFSILTIICTSQLISQTSDESENIKHLGEEQIIVKESREYYEPPVEKTDFLNFCKREDIKHGEIIWQQTILESGHYKSKLYKEKNNMLGLYDSKNKEYFNFDHWTDCLIGYRDMIQNQWDGETEYYTFLEELPYAIDSNYINKLKSIK